MNPLRSNCLKNDYIKGCKVLRDAYASLFENFAMEISDDFTVLNDLYPKATKHILVFSRSPSLGSPADVPKEHLLSPKAMHSVPSMRRLHLHVISQDFNSPHCKNKKHWNSFNTSFFRDSTDVIEEVEEHGEATLNEDKELSMELRCHRCKVRIQTSPA